MIDIYEDHSYFDLNVYGHSSSNTVAIVLNFVVSTYYILNKYYNAKRTKRILVFALINLVLIIIQQSRAGLLVASLLILFLLIDLSSDLKNNINFKIGLILLFFISYFVIVYIDTITLYLTENNIIQTRAGYENEARTMAQNSFFSQMTLRNFFLGYETDTTFALQNRTFNAFLDLWAKYGILPLLSFLFFFCRRIIYRKEYTIPISCFIPILTYCFFESILFGTFWDFFIFVLLFLSKKQKTVSYL